MQAAKALAVGRQTAATSEASASTPRARGRGEVAPRNPAWERLSWGPGARIQPKLKVGRADDPLEREADRVADEFVAQRGLGGGGAGGGGGDEGELGVQRKCQACSSAESGVEAGAGIERRLRARAGAGSRVPMALHERLSTVFGGENLDGVRIHDDVESAALTKNLGAQAFTWGTDIYFDRGRYQPHSRDGQWLLAHELAHTVQQVGERQPVIRRLTDGPTSSMDDTAGGARLLAHELAPVVQKGVVGEAQDGKGKLIQRLVEPQPQRRSAERSPSDIHPKNYIRWVQQSMNRLQGAGLIVDGEITPGYRQAVQDFQLSRGLPQTGAVDSPTQDAIIKANHVDPIYVTWVQNVLNVTGAALSGNGMLGSKTKAAIRSFQREQKLTVDGWVGVKTETELIYVSGMLPPGFIGKKPTDQPQTPKPTDTPGTTGGRFRKFLPPILEELKRVPVGERPERVICLIEKLMMPIVEDQYMANWQVVEYRATWPWPHRTPPPLAPYLTPAGLSVDVVLKHRKTLEAMIEGILAVDQEIRCGIAEANYWEYKDNQLEHAVITNGATRRAFLWAAKGAAHPLSVLSCYDDAFGSRRCPYSRIPRIWNTSRGTT